MRILDWYKKTMLKFKAASVKNVFPTAKHTIVFAFTCGGRDYYQFANEGNDLPWKRGMDAIVAYRELQMMCEFDYLKMHTAAIDKILTATKFNLASAAELIKLNAQLKERLTLPFQPGLIYNLAAIVYFDKHENPYGFDAKYAYEKVEFWKKHQDIESFFLQKPLMELVPFLKNYEGNMQVFSETVKQINAIHLDEVLSKLSPEQKKTFRNKLSPLFTMGTVAASTN